MKARPGVRARTDSPRRLSSNCVITLAETSAGRTNAGKFSRNRFPPLRNRYGGFRRIDFGDSTRRFSYRRFRFAHSDRLSPVQSDSSIAVFASSGEGNDLM